MTRTCSAAVPHLPPTPAPPAPRTCPLSHKAAASCGHNAVRHLQHAQLEKVHGEAYTEAHELYQQRRQDQSGSTSGSAFARRLQAAKATAQPQSRLQKLLQENQASTLRIQPVYQMDGSYMSAAQQAQVRDVLIPGAIKVLQQYIKVSLVRLGAVLLVQLSCASLASAGGWQQVSRPGWQRQEEQPNHSGHASSTGRL